MLGNGSAIERDAIPLWVRALPQLGDPAVDPDATCSDQLLTIPTRTDIRLREDFLQTLGGGLLSHQIKY